MKKAIIILIVILAAVFILLSLLVPSAEYKAERSFYRMNKRYNKIKINPDVAPPKLVASVERDLQNIIKNYPDTRVAKPAHFTLVEVYIVEKRYDEAIEVLDSLISAGEKDKILLSKIHFLKGLTYQKQDRWDKALEEFVILREEYPDTPFGLQSPLYIALYYVTKGDSAKAEEGFNGAAGFYERLSNKHRGNLIGYTASNFAVQAYMHLKKYEEAGRVIKDIQIDYPTTLTFTQQFPLIESVFVKELNRPKEAIDIYKSIIESTEDEKIEEFLHKKIGELLKEE